MGSEAGHEDVALTVPSGHLQAALLPRADEGGGATARCTDVPRVALLVRLPEASASAIGLPLASAMASRPLPLLRRGVVWGRCPWASLAVGTRVLRERRRVINTVPEYGIVLQCLWTLPLLDGKVQMVTEIHS